MKLASGGLVLPAAWFPLTHDAALVVGLRWSAQRLVTVKSEAPTEYDGADELDVGPATGATGVVAGQDSLLYFLGQTENGAALFRAKVDDGVIGAPELVPLEGFLGTPLWPQAVGLADGRTLLTLVAPGEHILAGAGRVHDSSLRLDEVPFGANEHQGVLAHVGLMTSGAWVVSYQAADAAWRFHASVAVSGDEGRTWAAPLPLPCDPGETLSDVFPFARTDRGADLYYARGEPGAESIRRRALHEDGTLGPEQLVTSDDVGKVEKPQPRRRHDGRITMLLTTHRGGPGTLALAVLDGDAPW
jgi:hypothetical protein